MTGENRVVAVSRAMRDTLVGAADIRDATVAFIARRSWARRRSSLAAPQELRPLAVNMTGMLRA